GRTRLLAPFSPHRGRSGGRRCGGRTDLDGRAVADLLHTRDDQLLAGLQPGPDDIVVARDRAGLHRSLARHRRSALAVLGYVGEELAVDPVEGHEGNRQPGRLAPDDARTDELLGPEAARLREEGL